MKVKEITEKAWTPEIGGIFGDLKIEIKADLRTERDQRQKKYMTQIQEGGRLKYIFDPQKYNSIYAQDVLGLVLGWENLVMAATGEPVPFNEKNKLTYLYNYADKKTDHEFEFDTLDKKTMELTGETEVRKATLFEFISKFSRNIENFEKN